MLRLYLKSRVARLKWNRAPLGVVGLRICFVLLVVFFAIQPLACSAAGSKAHVLRDTCASALAF